LPRYQNSQSKNADDIVITLAVRTPLTKARKGGFKDTPLEYLVYALLKEVRVRSGIDPALVEDVCLGNVRITSNEPFLPSTDDDRVPERPKYDIIGFDGAVDTVG
jgi:acetyl-CoA acetyltransferase